MSHQKVDRRDKLVKTWLKLEKCLEDFETEEELKKGKRPASSYTLTKSYGTNQRPLTGATRPGTAFTNNRPGTAVHNKPFNIKKGGVNRPQTAMVGSKSNQFGKRPISNILRPDSNTLGSHIQ